MFRKFIIFCVCFTRFIPSFQNKTTDDLNTYNDGTITEISIKTKINGIQKKYVLQSVEGYFAGEETKVWLAKQKPNEKYFAFDYTLQNNIMKDVNVSFYQHNETKSSTNENEDSKSDVINSDKVINPLTKDNEHLTKERSLTIENYILSEFVNRSWYPMTESTLGTPDIVYPEILVFVDNSIFKQFERDIKKTVAYILTLFNGVDLLFRTMKTPKIRLNIAGIVIIQTEQDLPFEINLESKLKFDQFMYRENQFKFREDYDIAVLIGGDSSYNIGEVKGWSTFGGACTDFIYFNEIISTTIIFDDTMFSAIETLAHELGHLFGSQHDGDESSSYIGGPGAKLCHSDDGYIMSGTIKYDTRKYFSKCSEEMMSYFFSRQDANCLRNNPAVNRTDKQILRILPAKFMSLDDKCQKLGFDKAFVIRDNICSNISCTIEIKKDEHKIVNLPLISDAPEGTACGPNMYCIRKKCSSVFLNDDLNNSDLQLFFPPPF